MDPKDIDKIPHIEDVRRAITEATRQLCVARSIVVLVLDELRIVVESATAHLLQKVAGADGSTTAGKFQGGELSDSADTDASSSTSPTRRGATMLPSAFAVPSMVLNEKQLSSLKATRRRLMQLPPLSEEEKRIGASRVYCCFV